MPDFKPVRETMRRLTAVFSLRMQFSVYTGPIRVGMEKVCAYISIYIHTYVRWFHFLLSRVCDVLQQLLWCRKLCFIVGQHRGKRGQFVCLARRRGGLRCHTAIPSYRASGSARIGVERLQNLAGEQNNLSWPARRGGTNESWWPSADPRGARGAHLSRKQWVTPR